PRLDVRHEPEHNVVDGPSGRPAACRPVRGARAERLYGSESVLGRSRRCGHRDGARSTQVYAEALAEGRVLDGRTQQQRLESVKPIDPTNPASLGHGLALASFGPMLGHAGSLPGFQTFMAHDLHRHLTMVVLTNLQVSPSSQETADPIARSLVGT